MTTPVLTFIPKFFLLDRCKQTALAVKMIDQYEYKGVYIKYNNETEDFEILKASFNRQDLKEFPTRYQEVSAWLETKTLLLLMKEQPVMDDGKCLEKFPRAKDFPAY